MPDSHAEEQFRALFRELRAEEPAAPPFAALWEAARRQTARGDRAGPPRRAVAVMAIPAVLAALVAGVFLRTLTTPVPESMTMAQWRSPTVFLMQPPGGDLLTTVPQVGRSLDIIDALRGATNETR